MLLIGPLLSLASAAVVTEIPPFLRGDAEIAYSYSQLSGSLVEEGTSGDTEVAQRALTEHLLTYGAVFSVGPGVAVEVQVPHYISSRVAYDELSDMVYDPSTGSGTYVGTQPGQPGTYISGTGIGGIWFGVRGTPFSEAFPKRNSRTTWLLEGAVRTGDSSSFWTASDSKRGAGPGGTALRLHTAFSTTYGSSSPYISGTIVHEGKQTAVVTLADGTTSSGEVEIDPPDHGQFRAGVELMSGHNPASGAQFVFDLHTSVDYAGWGEIPSGFYLPNVLENTGATVLTAEQLEVGGGLALHWRAFENLQISLLGDAAWHMPQRIEYPYPVYTGGDTVKFDVGSTVDIRFR